MKIHRLLMALMASSVFALSIQNAHAENFSAQHEQVKNRFQSKEEKASKDAIWTARDIFKVGVISDGTRRDGYAKYVCEVLYDYGFKGKKVWVQVIDIVKLTNNGDWVKLGESHCQ